MSKKNNINTSLDKLSKKLDNIKTKEKFKENNSKNTVYGLSHAFKIVSELSSDKYF